MPTSNDHFCFLIKNFPEEAFFNNIQFVLGQEDKRKEQGK